MIRTPWQSVLKFYPDTPKNRATIKRHYLHWRNWQGIPFRCDEPLCRFHTQVLLWIGKPIKLILDHIDGQKRNNLPDNLRLLCSLCNSQLETHGGGNIGRVIDHSADCYEVRPRRGPAKFVMATSGGFALGGSMFQEGSPTSR